MKNKRPDVRPCFRSIIGETVTQDLSLHYAFARGYFDARSEGVEANPYDAETHPDRRAAYRDGYDWGITDYCAFAHPEEVNT